MLEEIYWEPEIYEVYGNLFPVRTLYKTLQISVLLLFLSFNVDRIALSLRGESEETTFPCLASYSANVHN